MKTDADAVRETINKWGGLDGMILSAGLVEPLGERQDSTRQLSGREILKIADLPLDQGPTSSPYVPHPSGTPPSSTEIRRRDRKLMVVASGAANGAGTACGLYGMVKAGVNPLCRTLGVEETASSMGVWAVTAGMIDVSFRLWPG